jgi:hypothetical protein
MLEDLARMLANTMRPYFWKPVLPERHSSKQSSTPHQPLQNDVSIEQTIAFEIMLSEDVEPSAFTYKASKGLNNFTYTKL